MIAGGNHTTSNAICSEAPLAEFFGYFLVQRQESNVSLTQNKKPGQNCPGSCLFPLGLWENVGGEPFLSHLFRVLPVTHLIASEAEF